MDISAIAGLASSLKVAGDITRAMIDLRDAQQVQAKVIELQREIMAAQGSALAALAERSELMTQIDRLKAQLAELDAWERKKARYQLTDHGGGTFTYELRTGTENGEPPHRICSNCYQQRRKSILQSRGQVASGREKVICPGCSGEFLLGLDRMRGLQRNDEFGRSGWTG
jgi:hypothetical protein